MLRPSGASPKGLPGKQFEGEKVLLHLLRVPGWGSESQTGKINRVKGIHTDVELSWDAGAFMRK